MGWPYQQKPPMGWPLDYDSGLADFVAAWFMKEDGGNTVADLSGNGHTGTFAGDPTWVPGKFGSAVDFDGTGDYIQTTFSSSNLPNESTVIVWVKFDALNTYNIIYSAVDNFLECQIWADAKMYFYGTNRKYTTGVASGIVVNKWYQIVVVDNTVNIKLYIDGILIHTSTEAAAGGPSDLEIGGRGASVPINGQIDNMSIYNRALTPTEIQKLYIEPFCMFKDPAEIALLGGYQAVVSGMSGAMTTNTGYWGW